MRAARTIVIVCLGAASLLVAVSVAAAQDANPPFFAAGTWKGKGVIYDKTVSNGFTTITDGTIKFTLKVTETGQVSGTGKMAWKVNSHGPNLGVSTRARANLKLSGTPRAVKAAGKWHYLGGTIVVDDQASVAPDLPDENFVTRLTITKMGLYFTDVPGPCKVSGTAGQGTTWTAVNQREGCT
jgi:hypothetical protein